MINAEHVDRKGRAITLADVGADWAAVADLVPRDDQRHFVQPMAARYLLMTMLEDDWQSLAIRADDEIVGHIMWGVDDDQSRWIGGLIIDAAQQGQGIGRATTETLVSWLQSQPGCTAICLTVHPDNVAATALYASLGFAPTGETDDDEIVLALH